MLMILPLGKGAYLRAPKMPEFLSDIPGQTIKDISGTTILGVPWPELPVQFLPPVLLQASSEEVTLTEWPVFN